MQTVSKAYSGMWRNARHIKEHQAIIAGTVYSEDDIVGTPRTSRSLFGGNVPTVGGCAAGQFDLQVIPKGEIPRMAEVKLQTRLVCEKYAGSAVAYTKPLGENCVVVTPDGETYYCTLSYWASIQYGSASHYVDLNWSYSEGLKGIVGGSYQLDAAGTMQEWEDEIIFTQDKLGGTLTNLSDLITWTEDGPDYSEWIPKGTFYIDTRKLDAETGVLTLHGFDAMLKGSNEPFLQEGDTGEWPRSAPVIVGEICELMGVELDERTELSDVVLVPYPNDWTCREILSMVGIAHCGNWTITDAGKLRLVPLWSIPEATHYLVDQYGDPITLGGVKILV